MPRIAVDHGQVHLDAWSSGEGEPLLLIRTASAVDHLVPLSEQPVLAHNFRIITYDRRGYGASTPSPGPGSVHRDATDALAVLTAFGIQSAHVVGDSFSAAIALEAAITAPSQVRTLTLVEPPPEQTPQADGFIAGIIDIHQSQGAAAAVDAFMVRLSGPEWRAEHDRIIPGMSQRIERDAPAFFSTDVPALRAWKIDSARTAGISCPVLYLSGDSSGPLFAGVHDRVLGLLPHARSVAVRGAGHGVSFTHPAEVATAVAEFLTS